MSLRFALAAAAAAASGQLPPQQPDEFAAAQRLYRANKLREALPLFVAVARREPARAEAHAWLAETARRLGEFDRAAAAARTALRLVPCHAFAHTVLGEVYRPQWSDWTQVNADSAWAHLQQAAACDPSDGNPWTGIWGEALRRGDTAMEAHALARLVATHFLNSAVLAYGRWFLRDLPRNAVLVTAGDLDTWGVLAAQTVDGFRRDVAVVNTWLLNILWYRQRVRERYALPLPAAAPRATVASEAVRAYWRASSLSGTLGRPLAATLPQPSGPGRFAFAGAYWLLSAPEDSLADPAVIARAFEGLRGPAFALPVVSAQDRSPLRARSWVPQMIVVAAFHYGAILRRLRRLPDAGRAEAWAQDFGGAAGLPPDSIALLRQFALQE
ncbi:MAG TPA: hypothetical protein VEU55_05335 [Gemmatimonadales bacterium]|nr:hypothetical protein [Gemmatimonadales bacterium]